MGRDMHTSEFLAPPITKTTKANTIDRTKTLPLRLLTHCDAAWPTALGLLLCGDMDIGNNLEGPAIVTIPSARSREFKVPEERIRA